jgi:hypothetical protein
MRLRKLTKASLLIAATKTILRAKQIFQAEMENIMEVKSLAVLFAVVSGIGLCGTVFAQTRSTVQTIESVGNKTSIVQGSLKDGVRLQSLAWASSSANACFPATQNAKFTGNHVFYVTELPPHTIMTVTATPKDGSTNLSIYGYQIAPDKVILPEDLQYAVTCEADHKRDFLRRGESPTSTRSMRFNAIGNSYRVFIGVAGANGLTEGNFTLEVTLKQ